MAKKVVTVGKLLDRGLIKKSTRVVVNIVDLKKNGFVKAKTAKLALVKVSDLKKCNMIKKR